MLKDERTHKARTSLEQIRVNGLPFKFDEPDANESVTGGDKVTAYAGQQQLTRIALDFEAKWNSIESDARLTDVGKAEAVTKLADETLEKISKARGLTLDRLSTKLGDLQDKFTDTATGDDSEDVRSLFREREIRDALLALDESERIAQVWSAVDVEDAETLAAIFNTPRLRTIIPDDIAGDVRQAWLGKKSPALAGQVADLRQTVDVLTADFQSVRGAVENAGDIEAPLQIVNADGTVTPFEPTTSA